MLSTMVLVNLSAYMLIKQEKKPGKDNIVEKKSKITQQTNKQNYLIIFIGLIAIFNWK